MRTGKFSHLAPREELQELGPEHQRQAIEFIVGGIGCSEWVTVRGSRKHYYFNLDKAYSLADAEKIRHFHDVLALRIRDVANTPRPPLDAPILAYVCPGGAPAGVAQARGALAERLGWQSVVVFPDKRVLRSRVVVGEGSEHYPEAIKWMAGRTSILLADTTTTGESLARATGALRAFNCHPIASVVVYERGEGAELSLQTIELPLYSVIRADQLAASDSIDKEKRAAIRKTEFEPPKIRDLSLFASASA